VIPTRAERIASGEEVEGGAEEEVAEKEEGGEEAVQETPARDFVDAWLADSEV